MANEDIATLEALSLVYSDFGPQRRSNPYVESVDTRFESTLDVLRRGTLKGFEDNILGSGDSIFGIVLRANDPAASNPATNSTAETMSILSRIFGTPQSVIHGARIKVLKTPHTDIFMDPLTYDQTLEDALRIDNFPLFLYDASKITIEPGSFIYGNFDAHTLRSGLIGEVADLPPFALGVQSSALTAGSYASAAASTVEDFVQSLMRDPPPPLEGAEVYAPYSPEAMKLFEEALEYASLDIGWAYLDSTHYILSKESGGKVGIPNYTYRILTGRDPVEIPNIKDKPEHWPTTWAAAKAGNFGTYLGRSTATGLGQLLQSNAAKFYPNGVDGIGDAFNEAVGFVRYIYDRYGDPDTARSVYGRIGSYRNSRTGVVMKKTFREGY
tara:strand:- start:139 stop:1290 length:1152 start_codon:yes stop_codon:yes gene_type:complete